MEPIPLIKPYIDDTVKARVLDVLESRYLTEGPVTREFEARVAAYVGCAHAIAVCNCTVGLETALRALGVAPGDEVIVPDYTYPATGSAVEIAGAKIVIVDVEPQTMLIDFEALEAAVTGRTKAVIPVSIFGNPIDYRRLETLKRKHGFFVVEDAACSLGAAFDGKRVGSLADLSVFSFHPRKFITTGEGGMITTSDSGLARVIESYKHFGMEAADARHSVRFERIGTNYKLSNIQAAIGLAQMGIIDDLLSERRRISNRYFNLLAGTAGIRFPKVTPGGTHSWQSCCIFVDDPPGVIGKMREKHIETQIGTYSLHMHPAFNQNPNCDLRGDMAGSRWAYDHCLTLPVFHGMADDQQQYVVKNLIEAIG